MVDQTRDEQVTKASSSYDLAPNLNSTALTGGVMILIGALFLLGNFGMQVPLIANWWALFILIPSAVLVSQAWASYRNHGYLTAEARGQLAGALVPAAVAAMFLLNLSWGIFWPVILIAVGLSVIARGERRRG